MTKKYLLGIVLCLIAVFSWGGMFPVMAPALKIMDPFYFTLFRYGTVAVIFAIILLFVEGKSAFKSDGNFLKLWLFGTSAFAGFSFLVFLGQKTAGPSGSIIASVMMAIQPLLGVLVGWVYRGVKPTIVSLISMIVAAIGVFMVVTKGDLSVLYKGDNTIFALVLILLGALCWVIYTTGGGDFKQWSILRYSTLTSIYGVLSVIVILFVATLMGWLSVPSFGQISGVSGALIYMISFAGVIAVFAWNLGNRIIGPINGILFMNLVPITSFVISIVNGYKISGFELAGVSITILALVGNNIYNRVAQSKVLKS
ncbi:DMT family transporter [Leuconostoc gelidum subsp. gelidum]|uniref:DMT family transporter n=1 Tax=Leuconostoc gelidum subsp. gelidum TaxID=1607839 RepID=A0AB35FZ80_LEUGE|nr:DMT family transporter [Leuconostoc gelidum]MBZ5965042.1 DMT family transporter [Leuconostoc gelidum subsp. gelidum]MBZ5974393.1 DMT family transporter [Leuconostoc gelidum subsp. gelidum]MBZ5977232.1 DMT family transporter [Leuconostoc gelidum subsp. gelidum]MBZ5985720.1 DMT family transporter [Leuconostoc gelidum subsp. gelidum]MBZ5998884.1 DMT family transporter [Leuconostoc gelidum subsp. gelidum]